MTPSCGPLLACCVLDDLQMQEAPLRAFTRRVRGLTDLPYWERLAKMNLLST